MGALAPSGARAQATGSVPTQYITKLYTEALGRAPDQASWPAVVGAFAGGCTVESLKRLGVSFYTSGEYTSLGYSNEARLITLYRGALSREPDSAGFASWKRELDRGAPWATVVESVFSSGEFAANVGRACSARYGWSAAPVLDVPTEGAVGFGGGSGAALQRLLDERAAAGGGVVFLKKRAVVRATATLTIPGGVTLMTEGNPGPRRYAEMGRIVRASGFNAPLVSVASRGALEHVWIDGRRSEIGYIVPPTGIRDAAGYNVQAVCDVTISETRIGDAAGWTNMYVAGASYPAAGCASDTTRATIAGNLITGYASPDTSYTQDGISAAFQNTRITANTLVDLTDVHMVLFRAEAGKAQRSQITDNTVFSGGNAAGGGIVLDPLPAPTPAERVFYSFAGTLVEGNTIWTSSRGYIKVALSVGTRPWFGDYANYADGATVQRNGTGSSALVTNANILIAAAGLSDPTVVEDNAFYGVPFARPSSVDPRTCPVAGTAMDDDSAYAPASVQGGSFVRVHFPADGCVPPFAWPPPW
ncbi:DUF4214 domain-containing protein [Sorangium sp. So ce131]|uniref:DUF4214 domain-containing protein n=1 Tax=Sorangium sp. So ce131 TaxID=3133282 RepID=UPI003F60BB55